MMYAALYDEAPTNAPSGCIWSRQIQIPLDWISAFLVGQKGALVRTMHVDAHFRRGMRVGFTTDACPSGMGGFLCLNGRPVEWFAIPTTQADADVLGVPFTNTSECQQSFEALAMLIALRLWKRHWSFRRCSLAVASDNMATLSTICRMQAKSQSLQTIAREMALDTADAIYEPQVVQHVPGVANVTADALSRRNEQGPNWTCPPLLAKAEEVIPPTRDMTWWRSLTAPTASKGSGRGAARKGSLT